jgi:glycosyltransferase involved in cell wall biosynthesis
MRILFIHQNCPGQYKHIAQRLAANKQNQVVFIGKRGDRKIENVTHVVYKPKREPTPNIHRYLALAEQGILHGQQVVRACIGLKEKGFVPDIICAHPGWGEALYAKDVFPNTPLLNYFEFYYRARGADVGFDPSEELTIDDLCRIRTKNIVNFMSLESADAGMSPTFWQYQQNPAEYHYKISVIHDGIDTNVCKPDADAVFTLPNGRILTRKDEVITYVARNLEPYRGFPQFMRAVEKLNKERPNADIIIVGADGVSYGKKPPEGGTWKEKLLKEVTINPDKVHFIGHVPYDQFLAVLKVSSAHIYLTFPFVLSWSMMEAMSTGCAIIGSNTQPVQEVIRHGENGLLVDFFKPDEVVDAAVRILDHPDRMADIRRAARETALETYDLEKCLAKQVTLMKNLVNGHRPLVNDPRWRPGVPVLGKRDGNRAA